MPDPMDDPVQPILERHGTGELRFRAALVSSTAIHVGIAVALLLGPLLIPSPRPSFDVAPVRLVEIPPEPPTREPAVAPLEEEPAAEEIDQPVPEVEARDQAPVEPVPPAEEEEEEPEPSPEPSREPEPESQSARRDPPEPETQSARRRPADETARSQSARRELRITGASRGGGRTAEEFPFAWYLNTLRQNIAANWAPPDRPRYSTQLTAEVYFRIDRKGQLLVVQLEHSSGDELFDLAAERAIRSARFPPLPTGYPHSSVGVYLVFVQEQE